MPQTMHGVAVYLPISKSAEEAFTPLKRMLNAGEVLMYHGGTPVECAAGPFKRIRLDMTLCRCAKEAS